MRSVATPGRLFTAIIVSSLAVNAGRADGPRLESGLRVGEIANMFSVRAITGPYRGQTLCYRCKLGNSPVICVFARRITAPLTSLFKQLDARIASGRDGLKALVVFLTDDPKVTAAKLEALAAQCELQHVPLTLVSNPYGPQDYKIADDAEVTILMWKGPTVRFNQAFAHGKMTEADVSRVLLELGGTGQTDAATTFHVAPNGRDNWSGTTACTQYRREYGWAIRHDRAGQGCRPPLSCYRTTPRPVVVLLHAGRYELSEPLVFIPRTRAPSRALPSTSRPPGDEGRVVISGGRRHRLEARARRAWGVGRRPSRAQERLAVPPRLGRRPMAGPPPAP